MNYHKNFADAKYNINCDQAFKDILNEARKIYGNDANISLSIDPAKRKQFICSVGADGKFCAFDGETFKEAIMKAVEHFVL